MRRRREHAKIALGDPLSKETRTERKLLLAISALGLVIVKTGLIPAKITALGIEFSPADKVMLLKAVAAVIIYFMIAFLVYGWSDFLAWRVAYRGIRFESLAEQAREAVEKLDSARKAVSETMERAEQTPGHLDFKKISEVVERETQISTLLDDLYPSTKELRESSRGELKFQEFLSANLPASSHVASLIRSAFEFIFPILLGLYSIFVLFHHHTF